MKLFAIMDGEMFFHCAEINENYARSGRAIQTGLHSYNEFNPIFGHDEKWFDKRTVMGYLSTLVEYQAWAGDRYHAYALICKDESKKSS